MVISRDFSDPDIAHKMAARQREISVSEFFLKNRHLLGFDSLSKALLTTVKEAVDNALDACEEAGILPELWIEVTSEEDEVLRIVVEDNGPGIVEDQIAKIFGKLLYGSKFHKLSQSRGQQGIGIAAAGMYAQLTTGKPLHVTSRIVGQATASELFVSINTAKNRPEIHKKAHVNWPSPHGTRVEAEIEGHYQKGRHSIGAYLKQTAIANPHVTFHFRDPHDDALHFERITNELPRRPVEIKPHPRGVELGQLIQMLSNTHSHTLLQFLEDEFSRVGRKTAREIIRLADRKVTERSSPKKIAHRQSAALYRAMQAVPVSAPPADCLVPIGEERLSDGLCKEVRARFYTVTTRPPAVYRGNPFVIEIGIAYGQLDAAHLEKGQGGRLDRALVGDNGTAPTAEAESEAGADEPAILLRFANRVPMLYEQEGCAMTKAVVQTNWRAYGLKQAKGALPIGPLTVFVHMASVWVPFASEAKEAIASYPEIMKEIKLGLQQCGRRLAAYLRSEARDLDESDKRARVEKYLPHIGLALQQILELSDGERQQTIEQLYDVFQKRRSRK